MLARLVRKIPNHWLIYMYRHFPITGLKNWIAYKLQHKFLAAVLAIITNEQGQVLLLKHVYRKLPWGIPGGWMEYEQPDKAIVREIYEETGFKIELEKCVRAVYMTEPHRIEIIYRGRVTEGTFTANEEISEYMFCSIDHWPAGLPEEQIQLIKDVLETT